jgi:hypothetical protein
MSNVLDAVAAIPATFGVAQVNIVPEALQVHPFDA